VGDGTLTNRTSPVQVGSDTWRSMAGGERHTVAIRADGTLWAWGYNAFGQLGDGTVTNQSTPIQIGTADAWSDITAGAEYSMALRKH
jgi:alpha-tubulin suppressor-like RCC1 family protein